MHETVGVGMNGSSPSGEDGAGRELAVLLVLVVLVVMVMMSVYGLG